MKKFLSILLVLVMVCSVFTACTSDVSDKTDNTQQTETDQTTDQNTETTEPSDTTQTDDKTETETPEVEQPDEDNTEKEEKPVEKTEEEKMEEKRQLYRQYLSEIKVELLYVETGFSYEEMLANPFYPDLYGNQVTMVTLGVEFPNTEAVNAFKWIEIDGETAKDCYIEGEPRLQHFDAYKTDDKLYRIYIYEIHGAIDTSKAHMHMRTYLDDVYEDRKFDNNGVAVGFGTAVEKFSNADDNYGFPSAVLNISGRHYLVVSVGLFDVDCVDLKITQGFGYEVYNKYRIGLIPLDKGRARTLKTEDLSLIAPSDNGIVYELSVYGDNLYNGYSHIHTIIEVEARQYFATIELTEDGWPDYDAYRLINNEIHKTMSDVFVVITNDAGQTQLSPLKKK